jgi:hypothetical protein
MKKNAMCASGGTRMKAYRLHVAIVLIVSLLPSGCSFWYSLFGAADDEAVAAVSCVLNVFADTVPFVTPETVWYDSEWNTLYYSTSDGAFSCTYEDATCRQTFYEYSPLFSDYVISGELTSIGTPVPSGTEYGTIISGAFVMTGGTVTTVTLDFTLIVSEDGSINDLFGFILADSREIYDSALHDLGFVALAVKNANILYDILQMVDPD